MLIIGLTGGIGSGKSEVSRRFEELGITVTDADLAARVVVEPGQPALTAIAKHFGDNILDEGRLNRPLLRQKIFSNSDDKLWLESLLHPLIGEEINRQLQAASDQTSAAPYTILSSPLLLESQQWQLVDRVLAVDVSEDIQVQRSCARDSNSETQIRAIMKTQIERPQRLERADDVIDNSGNIDDLQDQIIKLDRQYRLMANNTA